MTTAVPAPAPVNPNTVTDTDYAMYEFTFQQRQLACQCLFYLTYCTMEESVTLIDLIRDLTNGISNGYGSSIIGPRDLSYLFLILFVMYLTRILFRGIKMGQ